MDGRDIADGVLSIPSDQSIILELPPSCIELSPLHTDCFVVGTYYLEPESGAGHTTSVQQEIGQNSRPAQDRSGSLMLFGLTDETPKLRHTLYTPYAILDLHFTHYKKGVFAIATSKGAVCLCTINADGTGPLEFLNSYQIFPDSSLTLSLAWNRILPQSDTIAASSSDGRIAIFDTKYQPPLTYKKTEAHSLEAWTLAWTSKSDESFCPGLASGGDDSALCRHGLTIRPVSGSLKDGNIPSNSYEFHEPIRDTKTHMAGVTAILPLSPIFDGDQVLLTGSYDEYVRLLLPIEGRVRPQILAEKRLGGGVWRLKTLYCEPPNRSMGTGPTFMILASCMHAGAKVLEVRRGKGGKWLISVRAKFVEHESMNYASDGRPRYGKGGMEGFTVISTSFYDKKLCVWETELCGPSE